MSVQSFSPALSALLAYTRAVCVVYFVKRTTGEMRRMVCIYDPKRSEAQRFKFNPRTKGLLPVFDVEKGEPRMINLSGVRKIVVGGEIVFGSDPKPKSAHLIGVEREIDELFY